MPPSDHPNTTHPETQHNTITSKELKRITNIQSKLPVKPNKGMVINNTSCNMVQCTANQRVLTGKYAKKAKYQYVGSMMNQKLKIRDPCKDDGDKFGKAFCLSIIHTGLNKCLSNEAILENYGTAMRGMKDYHKFVNTTATSSLSNVTVAPPVEVAVNKNNTDLMGKSILTAYRSDDDSLYKQIEKFKFWGLMHDGISKFSHEFNGVYLGGVDDNFAPFNVPFSLKIFPEE